MTEYEHSYEDVYCHVCLNEVCPSCGCCQTESCEMFSCMEGVTEKEIS
jgi:hypothetical protein